MTAGTAFALDDVVVEHDGRRLLDGISDQIAWGATTGVVGPSGSGKSTLLRLLNRFEEPTAGSIALDGRDLRTCDVHALRRRVGLVAQRPTMLSASVGAEVRMGRPGLDDEDVRRLLDRVALTGLPLDRATATLSGGEQQRLALARSLAVGPQILLLDEPTSALDQVAARAVDEVVRALIEEELTVVLVSHDLDRVGDLADTVLVLNRGRLVERGRPQDLDYLS